MLLFLLVYEIIPVPIFFLFFFFFILDKTTSCKNKMSSSSHCTKNEEICNGKLHFLCNVRARRDIKKLQNSDLMYYNVNLMTDVFKIIVKYRRNIIAKYRQISLFIAQWEPSLTHQPESYHYYKNTVKSFIEICNIFNILQVIINTKRYSHCKSACFSRK